MGMEKRKRQRESDHQEYPSQVFRSDEMKVVRRGKGREEGEAETGASPMDEEVEEFCAIMRRLREAVKYLRRQGYNTGGLGRRWDVLEAETAAAIGGGGNEEEDNNLVEKDRVGNTTVDDRISEGAAGVDGAGGGRVGVGRLLDLNTSPKDGNGGD
ncbi:hypothetical protein SAY87_026452 [Trapa incisa]|uniref:Uncharacterized protein n=1 Tax=Trapa incisa TaxID=236973 RepID=A0AAN7JMB9_9MYRT|nr:hypothetical protein SAY87_026452 [Trapa incisa]